MSNIGTFLLYGLTCALTFVASLDHLLGEQTNVLQTKVIPVLGALLNSAMILGVLYFALVGTGNSQKNTLWALGWAIAFCAWIYLPLHQQCC
jgi:asparagine N-glycosylation enzyme membrane subunit Stt3